MRRKRFIHIVILVIAVLLISCENNIEVIRNLGRIKDSPVVSANNMEILYSDSAKIKMRITAPEVHRYNLPNKQYTEFPKGITVQQYDTLLNITALIMSDYAIYFEKTNLWEAHGNVIAKNLEKKEELNTEELFWDQDKGIIYSKKFSRITNADGVFYGDGGFEAEQDLSKWHMVGIKGKVNLKEEPDAQ
jgi:LPS export ABC transporter protein LptC